MSLAETASVASDSNSASKSALACFNSWLEGAGYLHYLQLVFPVVPFLFGGGDCENSIQVKVKMHLDLNTACGSRPFDSIGAEWHISSATSFSP